MATIKNIKVGDTTYNIEVSYIDLADSGATQTSTSGTITNEQLTILQASKQNCIIFDNQIYRLQDNEHNSGVLTYSYVGYDTEMVSKTITITISTLAWTLTTLEISGGGGGGETETIVEVNLTGAMLDEATYNVNIPKQIYELTEEQFITIITNKNVVIKANLGDIFSDGGAISIYLKPFATGAYDQYFNVWYGFFQTSEGDFYVFNVGLKCVANINGYLVFENVGLINESGGSSSLETIHINVDFGSLTQYENNKAEAKIVTGTNISQADYNKLLVPGVHIVVLSYSYIRKVNSSSSTQTRSTILLCETIDEGGTAKHFETTKTQNDYFDNTDGTDSTEGPYLWLSKIEMGLLYIDGYPDYSSFDVSFKGYQLKALAI